MAVPTVTVRSGPFYPNGVTTTFPLGFHAMSSAEVQVYRITDGARVDISTGYTITGLPGLGTLVFPAPPAADFDEIWAESNPNFSQNTVTSNQIGYNGASVQLALDAITVRAQYLRDRINQGDANTEALAGELVEIEAAIAAAQALAQQAYDAALAAAEGVAGPQGPPGGDASQVGLTTILTNALTVGVGTTRLRTTGYYALGDGGGAIWDDVTGHAVTLPSDRTTNGGTRKWRIARDQFVSLRMFGAKADAVLAPTSYTDWNVEYRTADEVTNVPTDDTPALYAMVEWCNFMQSFRWDESRTGGNFWFANVTRTDNTFPTKTVTLWDGRTTVGAFIQTDQNVPRCLSWLGFSIDLTGSRFILDGHFNLASTDYFGSGTLYRKKETLLPFNMWKCKRGIIRGLNIDGQWRHQTTDTGGSGECFSYGVSMTGCSEIVFDNATIFDVAQDGMACNHRTLSSYNGITLGTQESFPEPAAHTGAVYYADGICHSIIFNNPQIGPCRRQGMSPVGIGWRTRAARYKGLTVIGGETRDTGRNIGQKPKWSTGDATDGSTKWQWRGFPPRSAFDFEPQRSGPYICDGSKIIGHRMIGNIGSFIAVDGDWGLNRVEQSVLAADVDATANSFTKASLTLPGCYPGILASRIRIFNTGGAAALPGGLSLYTDYFLFKTSSTVFKLARTFEDAVAGTAVDITSQGTGTHVFVMFDTWPNVGTVDLINCEGVHPWDGSLAPWQGQCERVLVEGGVWELKGAYAIHGNSGTDRQRLLFRNAELKGSRLLIEFNDVVNSKTLTFTAADPLITSSTAHGWGKYEYTQVRLKAGTALPPEFKRTKLYYATYISDTTFKLSASPMDAANGIFITPTTTGTGTQTGWNHQRSDFQVTGCDIIHDPRDMSFDADLDVDVANNRIRMRNMRDKQQNIYPAELLVLRQVVNGVGTAPTGLVLSTTYYPFIDENDPRYIYLAASSADAGNEIAVDITAVGSGKLTLAPSDSRPAIKITDTLVVYTGNRHWFDRSMVKTYGDDSAVVSILGCGAYGRNTYDCNLTVAAEGRLHTAISQVVANVGADTYLNPETFYPLFSSGVLEFQTFMPWRAVVSYNAASLATLTRRTDTVTVTGADATKDKVMGFTGMEGTGLVVEETWVSAADTVSITIYNPTGGAIDAAAKNCTITGTRSQTS